jgi:hypothetical protein
MRVCLLPAQVGHEQSVQRDDECDGAADGHQPGNQGRQPRPGGDEATGTGPEQGRGDACEAEEGHAVAVADIGQQEG